MKVLAARRQELRWIVERTACGLTAEARAIKAVSHGRIRGMVAYDAWTQFAVTAHMAVDAPIVWRSLLGPAFSYPFDECGKGLLLGVIPGNNAASLAMCRSLGFRETYRVRDGWAPGVDQVVHEMRREECRWLAQPNRRAA